MRRILSIFFIAVATFNVTLFTVMTHHHHGAVMCAAAAHCEDDHTPEEAGTHTDNGLHHCGSCIIRTDALGTAVRPESKCKCTACGHTSHHHHPLPAFLLPAGIVSEPAAFSFTAIACGFADLFHPLPGIHRHAALRAPPFLS